MRHSQAITLPLSTASENHSNIKNIRWPWRLVASGAIVVLSGWLAVAALWVSIQASNASLTGLLVEGKSLPPTTNPARALVAQSQEQLEQKLVLLADDHQFEITHKELGQSVPIEQLSAQILAMGRSGHPVTDLRQWYRARLGKLSLSLPTQLDEKVLRDRLTAIKRDFDREPKAAVIDISKQQVDPGHDGLQLRLDDSVKAVRHALAKGTARVALAVTRIPASGEDARALSLKAVLGKYQTRFSGYGNKRNRARNVYVATRRFGNIILGPGETFSFNKRVGPRTLRRGFRKAKGIRGGEMIDDDVGGGTCQVASTIHAAALLAGLEVVEHHPHSRPSGYIRMGLDATVAYPTRDLKVRNPYDFPIALHLRAKRGRLLARVLGPSRPFKTTVIRRIRSRIRFGEKLVLDSTLPLGSRVVSQHGIRGYRIERTCRITGGSREGTYTKTLLYPPTKRIVRIGTGARGQQVVVASATPKRYGETSRWPSSVITIVQ